MALLNKVSISDVPENKAEKLTATGIIGEVEQKEVNNGYVSIVVPIAFENAEGEEKIFKARWNVRPEWFEPEFAKEVLPTLEYKDKIAYQINMQRNTLGLIKAVGLEEIDFDALQGERVGFTAGPQKNDPSRLELKSFFKPRA